MVVVPVVVMVHAIDPRMVLIIFWLDDVVKNNVEDQSAHDDAANDVKAYGAGTGKILNYCC